MEVQQDHALIAVFTTRNEAQSAIRELIEEGFGADNIGYATQDRSEEDEIAEVEHIEDMQDDATSGAVAGVAGGGIAGGVLGAGAALLIPGVGPVVAAGILAAGVAAGAFAGGLYGPFMSMGATEEEAKYYDEQFRSGASIVTVHAGDREGEARAILASHNAVNIEQE